MKTLACLAAALFLSLGLIGTTVTTPQSTVQMFT